MHDQTKDVLWLSAAECADRFGVTVRALRLYEKRGLIAPRRTGKNWRLYGASELARLHEVLALKRLGLNLARITDLLAGRAVDLNRILAMQQAAMIELRGRTDRSLALIGALRATISAGEAPPINELVKLMEEAKMTDFSSDAIAWRRYEQARPRTEITVDPVVFDDYVGSYQFGARVLAVTRRDNQLLTQLTGQQALEIFPESDDKFFLKVVPAQITFVRGAQKIATSLIVHQNGYDNVAMRVDEPTAKLVTDALAIRIKNKTPLPNSDVLMRAIIDEFQRGAPAFEKMSAPLAALAREHLPRLHAELARLGPLQALSFKRVGKGGSDIYDARFANGATEWRLNLGDDGKFSKISMRLADAD